MKMRYPLGVQNFPRIIEAGYVYIDKTELIHQMIQTGDSYFLSRPRRFGKSLLTSTLESLFKGKKELFEGFWISSSDYNWKTHPVISLDFTLIDSDSYENLERTLQKLLQNVANQYDLGEIREATPRQTLIALVQRLSVMGKVVILIDEYDKPILDRLSQKELVVRYQDFFKSFFGVTKGLGEYLRFIFVTGVSKFTQVSLFSGMNHLKDLSFNPAYASMLGITENEIDTYFIDEIERIAKEENQSVADVRQRIKKWYNGYRFSGNSKTQSVYNPISLMSYLDSHRLANYWFATGTPTFAYQLIQKQNYDFSNFESDIKIGDSIEANHAPDSIDLITLLYQTGYLTIKNYDKNEETALHYTLQFPNEEVRRSFFERLFPHVFQLHEFQVSELMTALKKNLLENKFDLFFESINRLFSSIPYNLQNSNEAYYHSLIFLLVKMLGFNVNAEVKTSTGLVDLIVKYPSSVIIFEFKFNRSAREALQQIKERNYHSQYLKSGIKLTLIGANFNGTTHTVNEWESEII